MSEYAQHLAAKRMTPTEPSGGVDDLNDVVFVDLPAYSHNDRFQFICYHTSEAGDLTGLTMRQTWTLFTKHPWEQEWHGQPSYAEWHDMVGQGIDPRFAYDFLYNLFSKRVWFAQTKVRNERVWNRAISRLNAREQSLRIMEVIRDKTIQQWVPRLEALHSPELPRLRQDPRFIKIWKALPGINISNLDVAMRYPPAPENQEEKLWFLYDPNVTTQDIVDRAKANNTKTPELYLMIAKLAATALENEYYEVILALPQAALAPVPA
jgi:hypothetical protein